MTNRRVELKSEPDFLAARLAARKMARAAGLGIMDQTRFATAVSEIVRNVLLYAVGGTCDIEDLSDASHIRLQAKVYDKGPGIADLQFALADGYSGRRNLGIGLAGTRRLVDDFEIETSEQGTAVCLQIMRRRRGS